MISKVCLFHQEEIRKWASIEFYENNVKIVQLPFVQPTSSSTLTGEIFNDNSDSTIGFLLSEMHCMDDLQKLPS